MNKVKENYLKNVHSCDMVDIAECVTVTENAGLMVEIIYTALSEMQSNPQSSPLLCLQIAMRDWDV